MAETLQNTPETPTEPDDIDKAILNATLLQPNKATHAIAKQLVKAGIINNVQLVYDRLKRRDYLSRGIDEVRTNHREQISRELMPLALKVTRKALKSKDMSEKDKHPFVAMVVKSDLGDQGADNKPQTINIEHLERMQVLMQS